LKVDQELMQNTEVHHQSTMQVQTLNGQSTGVSYYNKKKKKKKKKHHLVFSKTKINS
jgi:hypothetical protein